MSGSCCPNDCSRPGLPVLQHLLEFAQVYVHCIGVAVQPSHPLMASSPSTLDLSQHQGLFQWVVCVHQMTKILELQLQHQSFHWILRLISLKIDWFVVKLCCQSLLSILTVQGTFRSLLKHHSFKAPILQHAAFFTVKFSQPYMTNGKNIAFTIRTFVSRAMSQIFNTLYRFVIAFPPRSNHLISWLWSPSAVILDLKRRNLSLLPPFPLLFTKQSWDQMPWS